MAPEHLPDDLSRLGDELERAAARDLRARRRRAERLARAAVTGAAAVLALAFLTPSGQGERPAPPGQLAASAPVVYEPMACDQPRGATFAAARPCATPGATQVEPLEAARRYAIQ